MTRRIDCNYRDPLSEVWLTTARNIGLRVRRSPHAFASTDGQGELVLSDAAEMDADDCIAQMIFHEICHFLVSGPASMSWVDWGLDNESDRDEIFEHACLRLQAALLHPLGLREVLGPTTNFRTYYDALPPDPFAAQTTAEQEAVVRARAAYARRHQLPLGQHVERALTATVQIIQAAAPFCPPNGLLAKLKTAAPQHPVGLPLRLSASRGEATATPLPIRTGFAPTAAPRGDSGPSADDERCGTCAWSQLRGPGPAVLRCLQAEMARVTPELPPCERYEAALDCLTCGACCREAYDTVEVSSRDPAAKKHLPLMTVRQGGYDLQRVNGRCAFLQGGLPLRVLTPAIVRGQETPNASSERPTPPLFMPGGAPFTCSIYEDRPQTCRDFALGSPHCLDARRRVGLSR